MKNKHFVDENKGTFTKKILKGSIELEVAMTEAAQTLADQKQVFAVPKILTINKSENRIEFELLKDAIPLRFSLNRSLRPFAKSNHFNTTKEIFLSIGETLALIHNSQNFKSIPKRPFPNNFFQPSQKEVYLHGDFTLHNLLYNPRLGKIAIIDWATPQFLNFQANWGPNLWDIDTLISTTFHYSPSTFFSSFLKRTRLVLSFLQGYQANIKEDKKIGIEELRNFLRTYNLYKVNPGIKDNFITKHSISMLGKFIGELKEIQEI